MFLKIFDKKRINLLKNLGFLNKHGFYLAGGTALALQLGHRTSVDFDFYTQKDFISDEIVASFRRLEKENEIFMMRDNTLGIMVGGEIEVTFFKYFYPLLREPLKLEGINIASIEDIAAMKVIAITQRGTKRDFIDVYYLLQKYSLNEILRLTKEKFPEISIPLCLKSLSYFEDAENDKKSDARIKVFDKNFDWKKAKKFIDKETAAYFNEFRKNGEL